MGAGFGAVGATARGTGLIFGMRELTVEAGGCSGGGGARLGRGADMLGRGAKVLGRGAVRVTDGPILLFASSSLHNQKMNIGNTHD